MPETIAAGVWLAIAAYGLIGAFVSAWLIAGGLARFDANAAAAPFYVKALWAPGMAALWPLMVARVQRPPLEDRE